MPSKMQLAEQHIIKDDRFAHWCHKAKNLYNLCLYYWRQSLYGKIKPFSEFELMRLMAEYDDPCFRALPAHTSQQIIKFLFKNIKSWHKTIQLYHIDPSGFQGKPELPKYKRAMSELYFRDTQVKLRKGRVYFPKMVKVPSIKTSIPKVDFCRIIPKSNHFIVEFIYTVEEKQMQEYNGNWMGVDVGLNNLATCSSNVISPIIINGRAIKAINNFFNKRLRNLKAKLSKNNFTSKRISRFRTKRNQKIKDFIHKASRQVVNAAIENQITKIIIGKNDKWKQNLNMGRRMNLEFTSIPHATLIEKIQYKAQLAGIEVVLTQEAYTSKCSALDLEPICKHETYMGKRKKRGLFVTATGKMINADVNGSLNIARLVLGDEIINSDSIRSCVVQPCKVKTFSKQKLSSR